MITLLIIHAIGLFNPSFSSFGSTMVTERLVFLELLLSAFDFPVLSLVFEVWLFGRLYSSFSLF
jgi:hypothetical protein